MGVYIKDMKKPDACAFCELLKYEYGMYVCPLLNKEVDRWKKNPKYCPLMLIEIQETIIEKEGRQHE